MLKNLLLACSLLLNGIIAYSLFTPARTNAAKMTCEEARSEILNKQATLKFSSENNRSLVRTHEYLWASDYTLRNIGFSDGQATFVYTAEWYPKTCGFHLPGIDGSIVRVLTNIEADLSITEVN